MAKSPPFTSADSNSSDKGKRKKKFSAKFRTGCDRCKTRRVKCDERKPECLRCMKRGFQCPGYAIPEAIPFQPTTIPSKAKNQFGVIDVRPVEHDTKFDFTRQLNQSGLLVLTKSYNTLHNLRPSMSPFQTPDERSAFGFYLSWTGPMLNSYGPNGDLWRTIVPQFAWQSPAIRELVFAAVTVDEKWLHTVRKPRKHTAHQALFHYTTGLKLITDGKTNKVESLVASLMAWTIEAMLFDYRSGEIHLSGSRRLINEVESESFDAGDHGTHHFVTTQLRLALVMCEGYNAIMLDSKPRLKSANPWLSGPNTFTLRSTRDLMSAQLRNYRGGSVDDDDVPRFLRFLQAWENADRTLRYYSAESQTLKEANHLLFNIACALLPESAVRGFSQRVHPIAVEFVFLRVAAALAERFRLPQAEKEILDETLAVVVMHLFALFPGRDRWAQYGDSIANMAREHPALFERTTILEQLVELRE